MKIQIRERLKPFSHTPGAKALLPGTNLRVEAFPTLIRIGKKEFHLGITGPVRDFTLEQDLEKNRILVFGRAKEGFYRLQIIGLPNAVEMTVQNAPSQGLFVNGTLCRNGLKNREYGKEAPQNLYAERATNAREQGASERADFEGMPMPPETDSSNHFGIYPRKEKLVIDEPIDLSIPSKWERLSLGICKKQDWDLVLRRFDLREILPVLFGLLQKMPNREENGVLEPGDLEAFCRTAFTGILVPCHEDLLFQGIQSPLKNTFSFQAIRSLFFEQQGTNLSLLPRNPFPTGRLTNLQVKNVGEMDLEWASGKLKRAILRTSTSSEISLQLQDLHSFRMRTSLSQKGNRHLNNAPLFIESNTTIFFDRFQK
ncbi:MAG: hypothetical protein FJZ64_03805 [Chlamydiae bacterium]|nr:hypothetical protein [Chlamydiota bacterium]